MSENYAVVVISFNHPEMTAAALRSVLAVCSARVVLVHNGSRADHQARLEQEFPDLEHLVLDQNIGFSGGANAGINHAFQSGTEPWVVFLSNDCLWLNNPVLGEAPAQIAPRVLVGGTERIDSMGGFFDPVRASLRHHREEELPTEELAAGELQDRDSGDEESDADDAGTPDDGRSGARLLSIPVSSLRRSSSKFGAGATHVPAELKLDLHSADPRKLAYVPGAAFALHRLVWTASGGFDERLGSYWEDVDLSCRIARRGFSLQAMPEWRVRHRRGATCHRDPLYTLYYFQRNRKRISWRYCPLFRKPLLAGHLFRAWLVLLLRLLRRGRSLDVPFLFRAILE